MSADLGGNLYCLQHVDQEPKDVSVPTGIFIRHGLCPVHDWFSCFELQLGDRQAYNNKMALLSVML